MTTLGQIAEQIKLLKDAHFQTGQGIHMEEVKLLVGQVINTLFKTEKIRDIAVLGDFNVSGTMIATYDNIPVEPYKDRSMAKLPVYPMNLPMGMGVWYVCDTNNIDNFFVPLIPGQGGLVKTVTLLNNFENRIAYEPSGNTIIFKKNLLELSEPVEKVMIQEVVTDVSELDEYDALPIPADMEATVIENVLKLLGVRPPTEKENKPKEHD